MKTKQNLLQTLQTINKQNLKAYGVGAVVSTAVLAPNAHAFDVSAALAGNTTEQNVGLAAAFILSVSVLVWGVKRVIGFFGR